MGALFVDTWGWLALRDKGERRHGEVATAFKEALTAPDEIVTTDYVLDETFTLLFRRLRVHQAIAALEFLKAAIVGGAVLVAPINPARFDGAIKWRLKYKDKPEISFTDFSTMVVMRELGLTRILTEDRHFAQVGLGFELVP